MAEGSKVPEEVPGTLEKKPGFLRGSKVPRFHP